MASIFLDLDGTLADPKEGITGAVIHALTTLGLPAPAPVDLEWVIGPPLHDSFGRLGVEEPEQGVELYREYYQRQGLFEAVVYKGIPSALADLQNRSHRLFLMTAKPHVYARQITQNLEIAEHLEDQFGPELDGTFNDKADLLAHALARLSIAAEDALVVGDRIFDLEAAQKNSVRFLGATWGYGSSEELSEADAICEKPEGLAQAVEKLLS